VTYVFGPPCRYQIECHASLCIISCIEPSVASATLSQSSAGRIHCKLLNADLLNVHVYIADYCIPITAYPAGILQCNFGHEAGTLLPLYDEHLNTVSMRSVAMLYFISVKLP